ncbi:MAG: hypothetical protein IMF08_07485 [Proteobacteria bacterium]|nr:hypothetical protein [Pseudomonadota bacterium]
MAEETNTSWNDMKWAGVGAAIGGLVMPLLLLLAWKVLPGEVNVSTMWHGLFILPGNIVGIYGSYHRGLVTLLALSAPFNAGVYAALGYGLWHARYLNRRTYVLLGVIVATYWTVLAWRLW